MYITFKERHTCIYFLYILNMAWHDIPWQMPYSKQHLHNTLYIYNHTLHYLYKDIVYMHSFIHIFIQSNVCFFKFNVYLCLRKCYKRNTEEKCMLCVRIICYFLFCLHNKQWDRRTERKRNCYNLDCSICYMAD